MKLIQIFALATALATVAAAQNTGAGNNTAQQTKPSPTPSGQQKTGAASAKSGPGGSLTKAKAGAAKSAADTSATKKSPGTATAAKGTVQTGVLPEKKSTHKSTAATTPAATAQKAATQGTTASTAAKTSGAAKTAATDKKGGTTAVSSASKTVVRTKAGATAKTVAPASATNAKAKTPVKTASPVTGSTGAKKKTAKAATPPPAPKAKATATGPSTIAEKKPAPRLIGANGRRDPFVSPIRIASAVSPTQNCTSGKRCLAIPELTLQGTVRDISGKMMAVVATSSHRTYTLRENDQVFNGSVEKITSDSIIFREYVKDAVGRESAKEVVKKMGPTT
jgi:Tfp pilus assembly protein PilP